MLKHGHFDINNLEWMTLARRRRELEREVHRTRMALFRKTKRDKRKDYFNNTDVMDIE